MKVQYLVMITLIRFELVCIDMERREMIIGSLGVIGVTSVGSVAFTTASVSRSVQVAVSADDSAIVGLSPGTTNAASLDSDGALQINTSNGSNDLNVDSTFTYGDSGAPTTTYLFSVTNNDASQRSFTLDYSGGSGAVSFTVYDSSGSQSGTFDGSSSLTLTMSSGATQYVHMVVDTNGLASSDTGLGGSLDITVE